MAMDKGMPFQAITTVRHGPTTYRDNRVIARCQAGRLVYHWDYGFGDEINHLRAAQALAEKLDWPGHWASGWNHKGDMVHVWVSNDWHQFGASFSVAAKEEQK